MIIIIYNFVDFMGDRLESELIFESVSGHGQMTSITVFKANSVNYSQKYKKKLW